MSEQVRASHTDHRNLRPERFEQLLGGGRSTAVVADFEHAQPGFGANRPRRSLEFRAGITCQPEVDEAKGHAQDDRVIIPHALALPFRGGRMD